MKTTSTFKLVTATAVAALSVATTVFAADPDSCSTVHFSDVGWTDITATTATAAVVLKSIGYQTDIKVLSVPVTYTSLKNKDIDIFLGNWMPTQEKDVRPYLDDKSVESFGPNLVGAKYTLATNAKGAELGIKDFKDIAAHKDDLDGKIYGIEPGNDGNRLVMDLIEKNTFGMKDMEVVESSEQGMLAQVARAEKAGKPVVFLGWEPHPMNTNFKLTYLTGGDDVFGPDFGGAKVYTNVRAGYLGECPNVGAMLKNLTFSLEMENQIMGKILDDGKEPEAAATEWLKANPSALEPWLAGVKTRDGKGDALAAAKTGLGL
ncbi:MULTISPECIES: choline ABC transporter substrate-binding protein [unclassified Rhizobium]|uniref:choline ABC transporter substrate-binding protein n=1 Tax=unclassified Rhizobium TaxID=2613769 RepID=UPI0007EBB721|nr:MULTISPECIES: choline ABC transporter substrate-binding protein [unclassified Rhizobium]ANM11651.1 proline/glycine betaine/choline ABC transporter substrate-binding protein [Rhizobium sp. N324]ANM18124.1 proline/glycine betaine/choline ABC transporter substrate-binding protein [Rhizobium sp. N541]ANM24510.1 proline/glycine betaine/choline ABC transporter substrate-binding protein [Rhizobium sp. N941]OYD05256.1 proline/glycine betaine/choline ABC transporter substrate-binding protein [Rhizobi